MSINHLWSHSLSIIAVLSSIVSNVNRCSIPPIGLIERHVTPSDSMCSSMVSDESEEFDVAMALLLKISAFSVDFVPFMVINSSPSISLTTRSSLMFSICSPSMRELILLARLGTNLKQSGCGDVPLGGMF